MVQNIRLLKFVVIILGLIIFVGLGVLLMVIGQRMNASGNAASPEAFAPIALPYGALILQISLDSGHIALLMELPGGAEEVAIFDISTGKRLGTFAPAQQP